MCGREFKDAQAGAPEFSHVIALILQAHTTGFAHSSYWLARFFHPRPVEFCENAIWKFSTTKHFYLSDCRSRLQPTYELELFIGFIYIAVGFPNEVANEL